MGCPVILSDRCGSYGPTDDVQQGKNGFVYKTGDYKYLAKLMLYLLNNNNLRKIFSDHSRLVALQNQELSHTSGINALLEMLRMRMQMNKPF